MCHSDNSDCTASKLLCIWAEPALDCLEHKHSGRKDHMKDPGLTDL